MYVFYVYVQRGVSPDRETDQVYAKVKCSYYEVAEYVNYLNNTFAQKYYFERKSAYIDTDGVIVMEK